MHQKQRMIGLIIMGCVLWSGGMAAAQTTAIHHAEAAPADDRHHDIRFNVGMFSAVGVLGVTYQYAPVSEFAIEGGVGIGFSGLQLSLMPKLSTGSERHRFAFGAGYTAGLDEKERVSHWLTIDLGYEYRTPSGFSLALAFGITRGLGGEMRCYACNNDEYDDPAEVAGRIGPQARLMLGKWF